MGTKGASQVNAHPILITTAIRIRKRKPVLEFIENSELSPDEYLDVLAAQDIYEKLEGKNAEPNGSDGSGQEAI